MDANVTPGGADALAEALREMLSQYDWTDPAATVEALAEEFYQEMGVMAPGKSVPIGMDQPSDDERRSRYGRWIRQRGQRICNAARAALAAQRPGPRDEPEEAASLRSDIAGLEAELMTLSRLADIAADDLARALYDAEVESREDDGSVEPDTAEAWDELPDEGDEASKAEWRAHAARVIAALASLERAERANESSSGGVSRPDGAATPRADDEGAGSQARPADAVLTAWVRERARCQFSRLGVGHEDCDCWACQAYRIAGRTEGAATAGSAPTRCSVSFAHPRHDSCPGLSVSDAQPFARTTDAEGQGAGLHAVIARSLEWRQHRAAHIETCGPCRMEARAIERTRPDLAPEHCFIVQARDDAAVLAEALAAQPPEGRSPDASEGGA